MESPEKPDTTTGNTAEPAPILASEVGSTAAASKPAQVQKESGSISAALTLALLQTDYSDLQSQGLKVAILARDGRLYASIEFPGHVLDVSDAGKKAIMLDGKPVSEYE